MSVRERTRKATAHLAAYALAAPEAVAQQALCGSGNVEDGYTFEFFHDGRPYNVEVVAATIDRKE